jgi:hypothetical protein
VQLVDGAAIALWIVIIALAAVVFVAIALRLRRMARDAPRDDRSPALSLDGSAAAGVGGDEDVSDNGGDAAVATEDPDVYDGPGDHRG